MRKFFAVLIIAVMVLACLTACGSGQGTEDADKDSAGDIKIVTTIFPEYDWARVILGDNPANVELILLTDKGVDIHSFQPSVEDIMNISSCDILIRVGGESDGFIDDVLKGAVNEKINELNLLELLGDDAREEEVVEGMESEAEHHEGSEEEEEPEYDEHVWLSIRNSEKLCASICDAICQADPDNSDMYKANLDAYINKLKELDGEFTDAVSNAETRTLLFGDRFPFRYFTDDYGIEYFAAFAGCSAESEASFETVTFLANKVDELGLDCVLTIENSDGKIANTIVENTESGDQKILVMNSMQSVGREEIEQGATYLKIMRDDLEVLRTALGQK